MPNPDLNKLLRFRDGKMRVWGFKRRVPEPIYCEAHGRADCYPCHRKPQGKL